MNIKKRIAFTLILLLVFNFLGSSTTFSETSFKAIGIKDNTKIISNQYETKNAFKYVKDGITYTTSAFDFHIFSKEAILNAHTNGNIATKDLITNGQGFGTNQSNELKLYEENYFMNSAQGITNIASDGNIIVGSNVPTSLEDNNNKVNIGVNGSGLDQAKSSRVYKETSESISYIDIDTELENLKIISSLFSEHGTSEGVTISTPNGENQIITVDGNVGNKNNYYLNIKANEISNGSNKRVLNVLIPDGKTLIINVDMAGVNINYLENLVTIINTYSNSESVVEHDNNILWNLYDSSAADKLFTSGTEYAKVGTSDYFMGTILAPNANIKYGAVNGSVIADKTQQNGQESHKWTFTGNIYEENQVSVVLEASKVLTGKILEKDMFSFRLLDDKGNLIETVKNDDNGIIKFSSLDFEKVGTYTYKIEELNEGLNGVTYDSQDVDVVITVTDNGEGKLEAEVKYPNKQPVFNNSYKVATSTSAAIEVTKTLEGKDLVSDMFSFELLDKDGKLLQTVKNNSDGTVQFKAINYDAIGEYKYTVQEVKENLDGITYDERVFDVTVNVTDDGDGNLVATVGYPEGKIEFTNKYEAKSTSVVLEASKVLTGKTLEKDMFRFRLLDDKGNLIETVKNDANGNIKFSSLDFEKVGTYTYKIEEVNEGLDGITYDSQAVDVIITVTDNGEGKLEADVKYPNKQPVFNNSYKAGSTSAAIEVTKTLEGKDLVSGMFSFELVDKDGKLLQTVKNNLDGTVQFAAITYDAVGDYEYNIREVQGSLEGVIYDKSSFNVLVKVEDDGNGNLLAKVVYPEDKIVFENKIIQGSLEIIKTDSKNGKHLENVEFTIRNSEGKVVASAKTDKNGKVVFEGLKYGKYTYQETVALNGYIIDNKKYSFEIKEDGVVVKYTMTNKRKTVLPSKTNTPNTGDTGIATAFIIGILGVGGLFVNNKRKIKNKNL